VSNNAWLGVNFQKDHMLGIVQSQIRSKSEFVHFLLTEPNRQLQTSIHKIAELLENIQHLLLSNWEFDFDFAAISS
jgi:hypothetical protein